MPKFRFFVPALVVGLMGATIAVAETSDRHEHGGRSGDADFTAWHQEMCTDRYARQVGWFSYLEVKLALSDAQRPAFENWKSAVLTAAKSEQDACLAHTRDPGHSPTILDREAGEQSMLKARLSALESELPTLQSLYQILSPEQKAVFDRPSWQHKGHGGRDDAHDGGDDRDHRHGEISPTR